MQFTCTLFPHRSLERKLQRPLLAKSRTLPSIPQSPTVSRVHPSDLISGSSPCRSKLPTPTSHPKACTLPPAGKNMKNLTTVVILLLMLSEDVFATTAAGDFAESTASLFVQLLICLHNVTDHSVVLSPDAVLQLRPLSS